VEWYWQAEKYRFVHWPSGVGRRRLSFCDCAALNGGGFLKIAVLWHKIMCSSVEMYRLFRGTCVSIFRVDDSKYLQNVKNVLYVIVVQRTDFFKQMIKKFSNWIFVCSYCYWTHSAWYPQHFLVGTPNTVWLVSTILSGWYPQYVLASADNTFWLVPTTHSGWYTQYILVFTHNKFWMVHTIRSGWYPQ